MIDVKYWMPYRVMDRDVNYLYAIRHEGDTSSLYRLASYDDATAEYAEEDLRVAVQSGSSRLSRSARVTITP